VFKTECSNKAIEKDTGFTDSVPVEIPPRWKSQSFSQTSVTTENMMKKISKAQSRIFYLDMIANDCHVTVNSILKDFGLPDARKKMKIQLSRQTNVSDAQRIIEIKQFFGLAV
jgi:hypothetical protein